VLYRVRLYAGKESDAWWARNNRKVHDELCDEVWNDIYKVLVPAVYAPSPSGPEILVDWYSFRDAPAPHMDESLPSKMRHLMGRWASAYREAVGDPHNLIWLKALVTSNVLRAVVFHGMPSAELPQSPKLQWNFEYDASQGVIYIGLNSTALSRDIWSDDKGAWMDQMRKFRQTVLEGSAPAKETFGSSGVPVYKDRSLEVTSTFNDDNADDYSGHYGGGGGGSRSSSSSSSHSSEPATRKCPHCTGKGVVACGCGSPKTCKSCGGSRKRSCHPCKGTGQLKK